MLQDEDIVNRDPRSVNIIANIGITIPAIVRHGDVTSQAELKEIKLIQSSQQNKKPILQLQIDRIGEASTLGALEVFWEQGGNTEKIGLIKNMNVFNDIQTRYVDIPLYKMPQGSGKIHVRYIDHTNKGYIFDEKWIQQ